MKDSTNRTHSTITQFASLITAIILAISLIFFGLIFHEHLNKANQNVEALSLTVNRFVDEKLLTIDKAMQNQLLSDLRTRAYFIGTTQRTDHYDIYLFHNDLKNTVGLDDKISSIYAYRKKDALVVGTIPNQVSSLVEHCDRNYIAKLDSEFKSNHKKSESESQTNHISPIRTLNGRKVISISNGYPIYSNTYGWLVINIDVAVINDYVRELLTDANIELRVSDKNGTDIFNNTSSDKNHHINSTVVSEYSGLVFHAKQNYSFISYYAIRGHILFVLAGAIILFFCIYRLLRYMQHELIPWNRIKNALDEHFEADSAGRAFPKREFLLDKLITQSDQYPTLYNDWQFFKRKEFITRLMKDSSGITAEELDEYCKYHDISFINDAVTLGSIQIDSNKDEATGSESYLQHITNSLIEYLSFMECACLVECLKENEAIIITELSQLELSQLLVYFKGGPVPVTIAVSSRLNNYREISEKYALLNDLRQYHLVLNNPLILTENCTSGLKKISEFDIFEEIRTLTNLILRFDDKWNQALEKIHDMMLTSLLKNEDINKIVFYLFSTLKDGLLSIGNELENEFISCVIKPFNMHLNSLRSLDNIVETLRLLIGSYMEKAEEIRKQNSYYVLTDKIKHYIENHIGDDQLSLNSISVYFNMNASTFSTIFKKLFGEKFIDYLIRLRIDKSLEMLRNSTDPVEIIATSVGYNNAASFSRAFKNKLGYSPSEYRKSLSSENVS